MRESMASIETEGLTRYYDGLCAVDHLDLTVESGELFAFLGPNGAGKTTTIRMLTGLIQPTKGTALIDGLNIRTHPLEVKARVGVVPERSNLYGELGARDNLIFMAQLYGLPRRQWRPRADELLQRVRLSERAETPFRALSRGMKRRLTIAAALVHHPTILFLDEPTTGLDVQSARSLRSMIQDLRAEGVTIFLTTHLIGEAERLCDRVGIIMEGKLVIVDTPSALRRRYQDDDLAVEVVTPSPSEALRRDLEASEKITVISSKTNSLRLGVHSLDEDLREICATMHQHHAPIEEIRTVNASLEDAFVKLTGMDVEILEQEKSSNGQGGRK
ncbi:MAG: ABC transporter ATP-binding protein [Chloroflexota bacterium]